MMKAAQRIKVTMMGCGSSPGVPRIGNDWGACDPHNPKNRRRRPSLLIEGVTGDKKTTVVIDTGPDFREQALDAKIEWIDAVFYTHSHADHCHGIDDLRAFVINKKRRVAVYADRPTTERLEQGFGYCFTSVRPEYPPILDAKIIEAGDTISVEGEGGLLEFSCFAQQHGSIQSLGFKIGDFAYSTDINAVPAQSVCEVSDLNLWIVDATLKKPHPSHFGLDQAVEAINTYGAKYGLLTHMHVPLDYEQTNACTPDNIKPGHDGLSVWLDDVEALFS